MLCKKNQVMFLKKDQVMFEQGNPECFLHNTSYVNVLIV